MMEHKLTLDHMSDQDYLRAFLLENVVDKAKRLKIQHSSSLSYLRQEYHSLLHPIEPKENYGYF